MAHAWRFARIGGFDQVRIETGADLAALGELDQKLWVALACPVNGLELDARTLAMIDADGDGRIHASELIEAAEWATGLVKDPEVLAKGSDAIAISAFGESDEAKLVRRTAKSILRGLGKAEAKAISVEDTKEAVATFEKEPWNGDGVVPAESAEDEALRKAAEDVVACTDAPADKSGKKGFTEATLKAFWEELEARRAWLDAGEADPALRPLGEGTGEGFAALEKVRAKIDDFFARRRVAAYDARALAAVNREEKEYLAIAAKDMNVSADELAHFPIAQIAVGAPLPLAEGVNPAWADALEALRAKVVAPLLGEKASLEEKEWRELALRFAPHAKWRADEKGKSVAKLDAARVRELAGSELRASLEELLAKEKEAEPAAKAIESVERIARYNRDLLRLANNFVSFDDFYAKRRKATFQAGTLYIDERACELVIAVNDAAKHATMAPRSSSYLVYYECTNAKGEKRAIVAAITQGDTDNLIVGRNGLFYDRDGEDWAATITKIVENPISVRQAFWTPYKRVLRFVEEQVARRAGEAEGAADTRLTAALEETQSSVEAGRAPEGARRRSRFDVGVVAAIGVAVGGLVAALGALLEAFFGLGLWMPLGVVGLMLLISGPSMAVAYLKLRKRNLGPLLDANGWAVNAQAKVNVPLGETLTQLAKLPPGSTRELADPYAEKRRPWWLYGIVLALFGLALAYWIGRLDWLLPEAARSTEVLGELAPAAAAEEPVQIVVEAPAE